MSVDQPNVVDFVGVGKSDGKVVLTISDHLPWDSENKHLLILQDKLNAYLAFIEGGELVAKYPDARGREVVVSVRAKYAPNAVARAFLDRVRETLALAGFEFRFEDHGES